MKSEKHISSLVVIDGNAVLHRAYHALPPLTTPDGSPINAVYGFISILLRIITDLEPSDIVVAFDTPKATFRKAKYVGYQANRPAMDSDLTPQFEKMYRTLEAMKIPMYSVPGYEADDVIGTIATQVGSKKEVIIVTGDRDILQLVSENVKVYMPIKGLTDAKLYGREEVIERMGVPPEQIADLKAFMGDASDNYPGVKGVGPKTALGLLAKYRDVEETYRHISEIPEKIAKKLAEDAEMAVLGKELATIVRDVPITFDESQAGKWRLDSPELMKVFDEFGFKTLRARVESVAKMVEKRKQMTLI